jgi:hypothetical protein
MDRGSSVVFESGEVIDKGGVESFIGRDCGRAARDFEKAAGRTNIEALEVK